MEAAQHPWPALGVLLLRDGLVTKDELNAILDGQRDARQQRMTGSRLGEILVERGAVSAVQVARLLAEQYELPFMDLDPSEIDVHSAHVFTVDQARRFSAMPINMRPDGSYDVAIADPSSVVFSDELRQILGSTLHFVVVGNDAITEAIVDVFSRPEVRAAHDEDSGNPETVAAIRHADGPEDLFPRSGTLAQLWPPLGALLVRDGFVSDDELEAALAQQRLSTTQRLGEILVERGIVSRAAVARLVAEQYELPFVELSNREIDASTARLLSEELARKYRAVPIARHEDGSLEVAIADPTSVFYSDDLHTELNAPLTLLVAAPDEIEALVARAYAADDAGEAVERDESSTIDDIRLVADEYDPDELVSEYADAEIPSASTTDGESDEANATGDGAPSYELAIDASEAPSWTTDTFDGDTVDTEDEASGVVVPELRAIPDWRAEASAHSTFTTDPADDAGEAVERDESSTIDDIRLVADEYDPDELVSEYADAEIPSASTTDDESDEANAIDDGAPSYELAIDASEAPSWTTDVSERADTVDTEDEASGVVVPEFRAIPDWRAEVTDHSTFTTDPSVPADSPDTVATLTDDLSEVVQRTLATRTSVLHISHRDHVVDVRARVGGTLETLGSYPDENLQQVIDVLTEDPTVQLHCLPTSRGAKITASAFDRPTAPASLGELGLTAGAEQAFRESLEQPGVVLVCGPSGSGVTSTLYAAVEALATNDRVVATVEDHIARILDDVDQTEIDEARGVTFATGLQQLCDMDADVILVSVLPDTDAATAALRCALAGRHVLAGMNETDAASAVVRLFELAVDRGRLTHALTCVVSQCLVPRVCDDCRETYYASPSEIEKLGLEHHDGQRLLARGRGCRSCAGSGSRGHTAAFEVLTMTEEIRQLVRRDATPSEIWAAAGVPTIRDEAIRLCLEGLATTAELDRVLEFRAF